MIWSDMQAMGQSWSGLEGKYSSVGEVMMTPARVWEKWI